jgi:UDPglucose--hexose-1-phosphate uridylyltransferase
VTSIPRKSAIWRVWRTILGKLYIGLQDPDFNYTIRTAPAEYAGVKYFHWSLSIIPRLTRVGGVQLERAAGA